MTVIAAPSPLLALADTPPAKPGGSGGDGFAPFAAMLIVTAGDIGAPTPVGTAVPPGGKLLPDGSAQPAALAPAIEAISAVEQPLPPAPPSNPSEAGFPSGIDAPAPTARSTRPGATAPAVALGAGRLPPAEIDPTGQRPATLVAKDKKDIAAPRPARFLPEAPHDADRAPDDDAETGSDAPVGDAATPALDAAPPTPVATATPSDAVATPAAVPPPNAPSAGTDTVTALDTPPRRPVDAVTASTSRQNAASLPAGLREDASARPSRLPEDASAHSSRLPEDASARPSPSPDDASARPAPSRDGAVAFPSRLREGAPDLPSRLREGLGEGMSASTARAEPALTGTAMLASDAQEATLPSRTTERPGIGTSSASHPMAAPANPASQAPTATARLLPIPPEAASARSSPAPTGTSFPARAATGASVLSPTSEGAPLSVRPPETASALPARLREGLGAKMSATTPLTTAYQAQPPSRPTDAAGATAGTPAADDRPTRATAASADPTARALAPAAPDPRQPAILPAFRAFGAALHRAAAAERQETGDPAVQAPAAPAPVAPMPAGVAPIADAAPLDTTNRRWPEAMVIRIEQLRDLHNEGDTRIRLHPDALGAIDVTLRRDGEATHVSLHAAEPATQALLADAQPRLQQLAETRGLRLSADTAGSNAQGERRQPAPTPTQPTTNTRAPVAESDAATDTRIA